MQYPVLRADELIKYIGTCNPLKNCIDNALCIKESLNEEQT